MKLCVFLKGKKDPVIYEGDKIDVVDFNFNGVDYKQIRCFKKGISKSELIAKELIVNIKNQ
ncbi:hypothetical protein R0131_12400 [Clostridium sp. AL.422]|uniref:hypothetical protein n=1 Tax=Clostridium TaxID=1485 RepID=UPI00293DAB34|nr:MULTISPECIES: hypothetical protein [unclassified Clostridium]MDV4151625.1 hypothetical protein [Clostridium sp. AL.422]